MQRISEHVYIKTGHRGCNSGIVETSEGLVMIDSPQKPTDALKWLDDIKGKGDIRYLINTEPDTDHVIGNFFFSGTIISHAGTKEVLDKINVEMIVNKIKKIDPKGAPLMEGYALRKPSITFSKNLCLYLGEHTFELMHLPGHTPSQIGVYIPKERVIFTGDNVFHKVQTFLKNSYPDQWLESLRKIEQMDIDVVVPGHGDVCAKSYLREQASFIKEWVEAVKGAIQRGLSKNEAAEEISFLDRYPMGVGLEAMGQEVQRMNVERLYDILSAR